MTQEIPQEKRFDRRHTLEKKFRTQEVPMRKNLDSQNTHDKKYFGPMQYPREKILDPRRYGGTMARVPQDPRWHKTHRI